ncbi:hypothetical protein [Streptomyces sp. YIM 98790]|uniref:hypothetical protein n=1 Tax=Streptomyces sp. YIM 98790 TaxID=2689077 RepID=UPI00140D8860|nr:hypothetical protein [Streptomyces sp. YIM 98790]
MGRATGCLTSLCLLGTLAGLAVGWSGIRGGNAVGTIAGIVLSGVFGLLTIQLITAPDNASGPPADAE